MLQVSAVVIHARGANIGKVLPTLTGVPLKCAIVSYTKCGSGSYSQAETLRTAAVCAVQEEPRLTF